MEAIILSLFMWASGVQVDHPQQCESQPHLLGEYVDGDNKISLCRENIEKSDMSEVTITKHELFHMIQYELNDGEAFLPDWVITQYVRHIFHDDETISVILMYGDYSDAEFEARIFHHLPALVIGTLLLVS